MVKRKVNQIKGGAIISYCALVISIVTGLLYTPWMVHRIGQANYGLYTLATSLINIFMLDFGLGSAVSRFVSKYRAENNQEAINSIVGVIYKLYIAIDIIILIVLAGVYLFLDVIYVKLTPDELRQFRIIYLMVAGCNIISFPFSPLNGILNAYERFIQLKSCDLFRKLFTVLLIIIALLFSNDVKVVVAANVISALATVLMKFIFVKSGVSIKPDFKAGDKTTYKTLFGFTVWTAINSIMNRFTHSFAPSVLGMTSSSIEIALYSPAVVLDGYFYMIATAVNGLFLPRVSRFIAEKREDQILNLMIKVGKYQITVLGLIYIGFLCVGREFMTLWMGPEYTKTYFCTLIIMLPTLITCSQQIANTTIIAKNLIKYQAKCHIITGVIGLTVSYVTSMYLGAIGVCIGTAVTALINTVYMNTVYYRKAGINVLEFYKKSYLKAIPCYILVIAASFALISVIHLNGWLGLVVKAAVISVVYCIVFALLYFSKAEKTEVLKRLKIIK